MLLKVKDIKYKVIYGCSVNAPIKNIGYYITLIRQLKILSNKNSLGILSTVIIYCVNSEYPPNDSYENLLN